MNHFNSWLEPPPHPPALLEPCGTPLGHMGCRHSSHFVAKKMPTKMADITKKIVDFSGR